MPAQKNSIFVFFYNSPKNLARIYWGRNFLWQLLAVALTYLLVTFGFDWAYFAFFRHSALYRLFVPAGIIGALLPILAPFLLFVIGRRRNNDTLLTTSFVLGQSALLGWFLSSLYKAFSGRVPPELPGVPPSLEASQFFDFGFFNQGIFWGWPSSHTSVAFAMAIALVALYPRKKWLRLFVVAYAIFIGFGASMSFHWFSDVVAGAIFGSIIGAVVGRSFFKRRREV